MPIIRRPGEAPRPLFWHRAESDPEEIEEPVSDPEGAPVEELRFRARPLSRVTTEVHRLAPHQKLRQQEVQSLRRVACALSTAPWRRVGDVPSWNELPEPEPQRSSATIPPCRLPAPPPTEPHPDDLPLVAVEEGREEDYEEPQTYEVHPVFAPRLARNREASTEGPSASAAAAPEVRPALPSPRPRIRLTPARGSQAALREAAELQEEVTELLSHSHRGVIPAVPRFRRPAAPSSAAPSSVAATPSVAPAPSSSLVEVPDLEETETLRERFEASRRLQEANASARSGEIVSRECVLAPEGYSIWLRDTEDLETYNLYELRPGVDYVSKSRRIVALDFHQVCDIDRSQRPAVRVSEEGVLPPATRKAVKYLWDLTRICNEVEENVFLEPLSVFIVSYVNSERRKEAVLEAVRRLKLELYGVILTFAPVGPRGKTALLDLLVDTETDRAQVYLLDDNVDVVQEAYQAGFSPIQIRVPRREATHEGIPRYWSIEDALKGERIWI